MKYKPFLVIPHYPPAVIGEFFKKSKKGFKRIMMIIWLASYPRSGNTLLRTILKHCFGRYSYADEPVYRTSEFRSDPDLIGHMETEESWEDFYSSAARSSETFLVKTHLPPRDEQPFLYVIRDGRAAVQSYRKFNRDYNCIDSSLSELILGEDAYGDWTGHYRRWNDRPAPERLILRFEELVSADSALLEKIGAFIGHSGPLSPWKNPLERLERAEPDFFNQKSPIFTPGEDWTPLTEKLFQAHHADLMQEFSYPVPNKTDDAVSISQRELAIFFDDIFLAVENMREKNRRLEKACDERLALIHELEATCGERLALIERLHRERNPEG